MPNLTIPNASRQMLDVLELRRVQCEHQILAIQFQLEEIAAEIYRLNILISAYDEIGKLSYSPVDTCREPLEYNSPDDSTTENMTLTERVKQMVLMHPGKAVDIAGRLGVSSNSVSGCLTVLANRGEIAHWPECYMWGPIEWTPPTKGEASNA